MINYFKLAEQLARDDAEHLSAEQRTAAYVETLLGLRRLYGEEIIPKGTFDVECEYLDRMACISKCIQRTG